MRVENIRKLIFAGAAVLALAPTHQSARAVEPSAASDRPLPAAVYAKQSAAADRMLAKARGAGRLRVIVGLTVRLEQGLSGGAAAAQSQALSAAQARVALRALGSAGSNGVVRFDTIPFMSLFVTADQLAKLFGDAEVASVQEDVPVRPTLKDSVPLINGDDLVAKGVTGAGRVVAILDTGSQSTHPMLAGKVVSEACYSTNEPDYGVTSVCPGGATESTATGSGGPCSLELKDCQHGTHVASIAAGKSSTLAGVAPGAEIVAVQIFSRFESEDACGTPEPCVSSFSTDMVRGLERVLALKSTLQIDAANMSLGGGLTNFYCDDAFPALTAIINNLRQAGVATVIASGNSGQSSYISFPACISSSVKVGATTKTDRIAYYSNHGQLIDLLAPGSAITAALPPATYGALSGTSMATPHAAGSFAMLREIKPEASVAEVLAALSCGGKRIYTRESGSRNNAKPRIDLLAARKFLLKGPKGGSWSFDRQKDARAWPALLGDWKLGDGEYQGRSRNWVAVAKQNCAPSIRIRATVSRVMRNAGVAYGNTGLIYKSATSDDGTINGYYAGYNACPTNGQGFCTGNEGDKPGYAFLNRVSNMNFETGVAVVTPLCQAQTPVKDGQVNRFDIISTPTQQTFKLNGRTICTVIDSAFVAGDVAVVSFNTSGKAKALKIDEIEIDADEAGVSAAASEAASDAGVVRPVAGFRTAPASVRESVVDRALASR